MNEIPLSTLRTGSCAIVRRCLVSCEERELLAAMGLSVRCSLRVCRAGQPCIIRVAGTRLGLSSATARRVMVQPVTDRPAA